MNRLVASAARLVQRLQGRRSLTTLLLVPLVAMTSAVGAIGVAIVSYAVSDQARDQLDDELVARALSVQADLRDVGLRLTDAARVGANLEGMADALADDDQTGVYAAVATVYAVDPTIDAVVVTGVDGSVVAEVHRSGNDVASRPGAVAADQPILSTAADGVSGLLSVPDIDEPLVGVGWIVRGPEGAVGQVVTARRVTEVADEAVLTPDIDLSLLDPDGVLLTGAAPTVSEEVSAADTDSGRRVVERGEDGTVFALYAPLRIGRDPIGTVRLAVPAGSALGEAAATARWLAVLTVGAIAGIVIMGWLISRAILRQIGPLLSTTRAVGRGDLSARVPVLSSTELGELAEGYNSMTGQLEAAERELHLQVANNRAEVMRLVAELNQDGSDTGHVAELVHSLRNDIFAVQGYGELLLDERFTPDWTEARLKMGDAFVKAAERMSARVDEVLEQARERAALLAASIANPEPTELGPVFDDLESPLGALAARGDLDFFMDIAEELPVVMADAMATADVIMNLVSNAVKYTPSPGEVRLKVRHVSDELVVSVSDTGIGIREAARAELFEPFYRVQGNEAKDGFSSSGLGLASAKRVVEAQGGDIWCESEPGMGSVFSFTLRVAPDTLADLRDQVVVDVSSDAEPRTVDLR